MAARYPQTYRDKALAMMMASATEEDGEWKPQYKPVAAELKEKRGRQCSEMTLRRWWRERNRKNDVALRRASTRAREELEAEGARDWIRSFYESCQRAIVNIAGECETGGVVGFDDKGRAHFVGERVDARARAIKLSNEVAPAIVAHLSGDNETAKGRTTDRLTLILRQARISGLLTEEDESE